VRRMVDESKDRTVERPEKSRTTTQTNRLTEPRGRGGEKGVSVGKHGKGPSQNHELKKEKTETTFLYMTK